MGYIYEELIRVTADLSNEEAGEHFTPREVIQLMVNLCSPSEDKLLTPGRIAKVYDPACGTGGMLSVAEEHLRTINPSAGSTYTVKKFNPSPMRCAGRDMMLKGQDASHRVRRLIHAGRLPRRSLRLHARQSTVWQGLEANRDKDQGRAPEPWVGRPLRGGFTRDHRWPDPVPPADDLEDAANSRWWQPNRRRFQWGAAVLWRRRFWT